MTTLDERIEAARNLGDPRQRPNMRPEDGYLTLILDLAADRERLRTALSDFVAMGEQYGWDEALTGRNLLMKQARAALASEPRA